MRKPRATTTSRFARSPSSACAPSIPSSAPIGAPSAARRASRPRVRARAHGHERAARAGDGLLEALGLELRPPQRPAPGERRELRDPEQRQQIEGVPLVALDVEAERNHGGGREELEPDAAFLQPRKVDVAHAAAPQQVSTREQ